VKNIVQPGRPQTKMWQMRITCRIPKATNTRTEYVLRNAFPLRKWLLESLLMLRYTYSYIACLVLIICTSRKSFRIMVLDTIQTFRVFLIKFMEYPDGCLRSR
jgi:hypothetical protein